MTIRHEGCWQPGFDAVYSTQTVKNIYSIKVIQITRNWSNREAAATNRVLGLCV